MTRRKSGARYPSVRRWVPGEWKGHKLNVIDTPGYFDFAGEVKGALRVVEGALVVVCAASGVEVGTDKVWGCADERNWPGWFSLTRWIGERRLWQSP